jgi:hypothetical protein
MLSELWDKTNQETLSRLGPKTGIFEFGNYSNPYLILFRHRNAFFRLSQFSSLFFSMREAKSEIIVLVGCIIKFSKIKNEIKKKRNKFN